MPKVYQPPTGRIRTDHRPFEEIVRDLRHAIFSVVRNRPVGGNQFQATPLGSGFFVSPEVLLTCAHVLDPATARHEDGDFYLLVRTDSATATVHSIPSVKRGEQLHLFPDCDLGILVAGGLKGQAYAALDYNDWAVGKDIGVAGYPIPRLNVANGQLAYDGLIFRVARGIVTSTFKTQLTTDNGVLPNVSVIEVNFLFVPGNSGGPVFDATTGRVGGYVECYTTTKIRERVEQANPQLAATLPQGLGAAYIENINALYSLGLKVDQCRAQLERFGVKL